MRTIHASFIAMSAIAVLATTVPTFAANPDPDANRYIMRPANGGFIRMDTRTGALSFCTTSSGGVQCKLADDDKVAIKRDMDALKKKNKELSEENRRLEDMLLGDDKSDGKPGDGKRRHTFKLPSEKDVDQALGYIERMYKKFRDKIQELETRKKDGTGIPL